MTVARCSDEEFMRLFEAYGKAGTAKRLGLGERPVAARRRRLERLHGVALTSPSVRAAHDYENHPERHSLTVEDGVVIIGSDAHFWPGPPSPAQRAFVKFCKELKPKIVVMNGDIMDGASVSRHPSIGWEDKPSVAQEIEAANERLDEIMVAAGRKCELAWALGNHDGRLESRIANVAPELARVKGVHLKDHFNIRWTPCWSVWINEKSDHPVVIKHRYKGGKYATANNTLHGGITMVTGHLHSLRVFPHTDYRGTRWGVDCGSLADIWGPQFRDYMEDNPRDWRSGFVVLTFSNGELLWPEIARVLNKNEVDFRGSRVKI